MSIVYLAARDINSSSRSSMREPSGDHAGDAQHPAAAKLAIERVGGAEGLLQLVAEIHQGARREGSRPKLPIRTPTRHSRASIPAALRMNGRY